MKWREDTREEEGKTKTLIEVNKWLQWLETADSESDGD